jgi:DNA polymerase III subunit chi
MLEVSFYILPSASLQERDVLICKLAEKAYRQGIYSVILTASEAHSKLLDDLLWTLRANSFIPHQIISENNVDYPKQILISADMTCLPKNSTLINVSQQTPSQPLQFERILEIVHQESLCLAAGRERYRHYQAVGAKLTTHKL